MKHSISVQNDVVLVVVSEKANPEGYSLAARDIVNLPEWKTGMKILIEYSHLDLSSLASADAPLYAKAIVPYKEAMGSGRMACVNSKPAYFGMGRMWQVSMEAFTDLQVGIFYTMEEAMSWLSEPDQPK
ncbi:MAG: hypothetical protein K4571_10360 [Deltaproteobacteria bacterium]